MTPAPILMLLASVQTLHGRGVYYLETGQQCPLPGVGARAANACLRVALDDDATSVEIDRAAHRILFRNQQRYPDRRMIGDVLLLGWGRSAAGERTPVAVHLFVRKKGDAFEAKPHAHAVLRERPRSIDLDPYRVMLSDGTHDSEALTPESARRAIENPGLAARLAGELVQVRDNLRKRHAGAGGGDDHRIADVTVALGLGPASSDVARAQLVLTGGGRPAGVPDLLRGVDWELRIEALSRFVPKEVLARDLFLYGIEDLPMLQAVKRDGISKGESLVFSVHGSKGRLSYKGQSAELPRAADSARAFLEFSFLGAVLEHQAERTLAAAPSGAQGM